MHSIQNWDPAIRVPSTGQDKLQRPQSKQHFPSVKNPNTKQGDRIEFSDQAALVSKALSDEATGYDPVPALRDAIANGTYDLEGRLGEDIDDLIFDLVDQSTVNLSYE